MRNFDTDTIRIITAFENITGTEVRDCICSEIIYFLVNPGKIAIAIGKNGQNIKIAEKMLGKPIKVFEWSENNEEFIRNLIPQAQKIEINGDKATVTLKPGDRGVVIGKSGSKIKIIRMLLRRNSSIKELKVL
jgi:NusA-like KH domain protein